MTRWWGRVWRRLTGRRQFGETALEGSPRVLVWAPAARLPGMPAVDLLDLLERIEP